MGFLVLLCAALMATMGTLWCRREYWIPVAVYLGAYTFTTAVGAAWFLSAEGAAFMDDVAQKNPTPLILEPSFNYLLMLVLPFLIPFLILFIMDRPLRKSRFWDRAFSVLDAEVSSPLFILILGGLSAMVFAELFRNGFLSFDLLFGSMDYFEKVEVRLRLFETFRGTFLGLIYTGLPTLTFCALYQAVKKNTPIWKLLTVASFLSTFLAISACQQKGLLLVFFVGLFLAAGHLRILKPKYLLLTMLVVGGYFFRMLTSEFAFIEGLVGPELAQELFKMVILRMALAYPYYVDLYPQHVGQGTSSITQDVLQVMADGRTERDFEGNAPAASHVIAFAQSGHGYALATVLLVAVFIALVARLGGSLESPVRFSIYIQTLVSTYFLSQVSVIEAILPVYGFSTAIVVLAPAILYSQARPSGGTG